MDTASWPSLWWYNHVARHWSDLCWWAYVRLWLRDWNRHVIRSAPITPEIVEWADAEIAAIEHAEREVRR